ncbi:helix-turn-helix domain-containing protein [Thalassobacillus sp. CUG 92003]|uniref:helix-turn-helix domain-containing protein n=1 Tax=Thalassobacillus sp. CUG 92003 TaxID=2736641 RepID=UPI0015E7C241|nr:helix-turn-helix domain-containing protein [Thalassobacillus sp. CUG 92003]
MHYLNEFSTFENTAQLNRAIYEHIRNHTYDLNETDRTTLKLIARYAVKYAGAAHLKADSIGKAIGKSVKTARRVLTKLERLGIVKKHATVRKVNGGKGANIIVILPSDQSSVSTRADGEKLTESKAEDGRNENEPSDSIKLLKHTINKDTPRVPNNALRSALPSAVYKAMSPFVNSDVLYKYYGLLLKAKRKVAPSTLIENDSAPYVEAFNAVMFKAKRGLIRNIERYLYVAFEKAAAEVARRNAWTDAEEKGEAKLITYDWLEGLT